jgi:hypothetical protein
MSNALSSLHSKSNRRSSGQAASVAAPAPQSVRVLHVNAGNMYGGVETILVTLARLRHLYPTMEPCFALCQQGRLSEELAEAGAGGGACERF